MSSPQHTTPTSSPLFLMGWDAATWDLMTPWLAQGKLPNLSALMARGCYGTLQSVPQPVSPAAWTSIVTGENPARHGVYDWFERKPDSYDVEYVHTGRIGAKSIWGYFNEAGKTIGVFNLPMMYPAPEVEGFAISGMAAPGAKAKNFTYPEALIAEIEAAIGPYLTTEPTTYTRGREAEYLQAVLHWLDYQRKTVEYLIQTHPADCYLVVFMQADHAQHKFWHTLTPGHPHENTILQVYQALDDALGAFLSLLPSETTVMALSDHGAGPMDGVMYLNRWLQDVGLLHIRQTPLSRLKNWLAKTDLIMRAYRVLASLGLGGVANLIPKSARNKMVSAFVSFDDVDWMRTKAYARGSFGQIYINLAGREPQGIVPPEGYAPLVDEIIALLKGVGHPETGEPLIRSPWRRSEKYTGPFLAQAADINFSIQDFRYQAAIKMGLSETGFFGPSEYDDSGTHRYNGMFALAGPGIDAKGEIPEASLLDILPTALALADLSVPTHLDGQPLSETFTAAQKSRLVFSDERGDSVESFESAHEMSPEDTETLEQRLRNLGYLG